MKNQNGSTLVEAVLTVLIVAIATMMITSAFLTAMAINKDTQGEYDRVSSIYDNIELGTSATDTSWQATQVGGVTFSYGGTAFDTITGTFTYDSEQEKIGEFIAD